MIFERFLYCLKATEENMIIAQRIVNKDELHKVGRALKFLLAKRPSFIY